MKIALISIWFSEKTGYAENLLPKALAQLGHDVHLITSCAQVYANTNNYKDIYENFLGQPFLEPIVKTNDGFTLHRLQSVVNNNTIEIVDLENYIVNLNPEIIQTFEINEQISYSSALASVKIKAKFFTESHMHKSVFRIKKENIFSNIWKKYLKKNWTLDFINSQTEICYPIGKDVAELAINHFRVPKSKIKIQSLGVDTNFFKLMDPNDIEIRNSIRKEFHFKEEDIVCIYTGRFSIDKGPNILADAINYINDSGKSNFKALFVGSGTKKEVDYISSKKGCHIISFVPFYELNKYYWSSDIAIWPKQESTSQLDAMSCGLPIILSNKISLLERVEGNGLLYQEDNYINLAETILQLENKDLRIELGKLGSLKIQQNFSWLKIAKDRSEDYNLSLNGWSIKTPFFTKLMYFFRSKIY
jgi:glycosyltransferase involved in cell wall biosynthesis